MISAVIILISLSLLIATDPDPVSSVVPTSRKRPKTVNASAQPAPVDSPSPLASRGFASLEFSSRLASAKSRLARLLGFVSPCQ